MSVRLLFPSFVFHRNLLSEDLPEDRKLDQGYLDQLVREINQMRYKDPEGRRLSNAYTGWQSHDGCESHPAFQKIMRQIENTFYDEVWPFHGLEKHITQLRIGNSWANINDSYAWNRPHLHPGCWYSGVFYIRADGDEGYLTFIDKDVKFASDYPACPRNRESFEIEPHNGQLYLFPSGLMHMVEPNLTDKDRYSISFNIDIINRQHGEIKDYNNDEFVFTLDENGNPLVG